MRLRYPLSSYDHNFCLKPPPLLWAALLYLSRAVTLPLLVGLSAMAGVSSDTRAALSGLIDVQTLLPSALAALVLFALLRRAPSASRAVRWIWGHGQLLLAVAAGLDFVLTLLASPLRYGELDEQAGFPLLAAGIDLCLLFYVLIARRVRDTFGDFPEPVEAAPH